jgi:hypothetical protein
MEDPNFQHCDHIYKVRTEAMHKMLDYIITCAAHDEEHGIYNDAANTKKLRDAGEMMYQIGGKDMMGTLIAICHVPMRYWDIIDDCWHDIGDFGVESDDDPLE